MQQDNRLDLYQLTNKLNFLGLDPQLKSARDLSMLAYATVDVYRHGRKLIYSHNKQQELLLAGENLQLVPGRKERYVNTLYHVFSIPKSNGKRRIVTSLEPYLHGIHDKLLKLMYPVLNANLPPEICGCRPGVGITDIAKDISMSMRADSLIGHLDVVNWYPSIKKDTVREILNKYLFKEYLSPKNKTIDTADLVAIILTYKGKLPQGGPCSPLIANIVAMETWAQEAIDYCKNNKLFVRVYVDNIIVTTQDKNISSLGNHLTALSKIVQSKGYGVHKRSIHASYRRQKVLGIIFNKPFGPRVPRSLKSKINTILFKAYKMQSAGQDRFPIIQDWINKYGGMTKIESGDFGDAKYRSQCRAKFYSWLMGVLNWTGQFAKDSQYSIDCKKRLELYLHPIKII